MTSIRILRLPKVAQRGYGVGGVFSRIFSSLKPFISSLLRSGRPLAQKALKHVGEQAIETGSKIISDVAAGEDVKSAVKSRGKEALKKGKDAVLKKAKDIAEKGINRQTGGRKRKRKKNLKGGKKVQRGGKNTEEFLFTERRKPRKRKKQ